MGPMFILVAMLAYIVSAGGRACVRTDIQLRGITSTSATIPADCSSLLLAEKNIGDNSITALAEALKSNAAVKMVDFGSNKVGR